MSEVAPQSQPRPRRVWLTRLLIIFGLLTLVGLTISTVLFFSMTDWQTLTTAEADARMTEAIAAAGGTEPFLERQPNGDFALRRDLEPPNPVPIGRLHLLAWIPARSKMVEVRVPAWFVRLKAGSSFGLAALAAEFADALDGREPFRLEDLQRRGPGLLMDLRLDDGRRILIWSAPQD
jgi:hypothetical protein